MLPPCYEVGPNNRTTSYVYSVATHQAGETAVLTTHGRGHLARTAPSRKPNCNPWPAYRIAPAAAASDLPSRLTLRCAA